MDKTNFSEEENVSLLDTILLFFNYLKSIIINTFKIVGKMLSFILRFIIKHFFLLLIAFISGTCLIFIYNKYYEQNHSVIEMKLICDDSIFDNIETEIERLNILAKHKSFYLSSNSNIPINSTVLHAITNIKIGYCMDKDGDGSIDFVTYKKEEAINLYKDILANGTTDIIESKKIQEKLKNTLFIRLYASTLDKREIESIKNAIVLSLNSNENIKHVLSIKTEFLSRELSVLTNQISLLDSLIKSEYRGVRHGENIVMQPSVFQDSENENSITIGRKLYHNSILELERRRNSIMFELDKAKEAVTLTSNVYYPHITPRPNLFAYILTWMLLFVAICLLIDYKKPIINYIIKSR